MNNAYTRAELIGMMARAIDDNCNDSGQVYLDRAATAALQSLIEAKVLEVRE